MTAGSDLGAVLVMGARLPLRYWKERMLFRGLQDQMTSQLTGGLFPAKLASGAHPAFSLQELPDRAGFRVCPCSSRKPFHTKRYRYIKEGSCLRYTGHITDRNSYLIENVPFNIPPAVARTLRFMGEVPEECIGSETIA